MGEFLNKICNGHFSLSFLGTGSQTLLICLRSASLIKRTFFEYLLWALITSNSLKTDLLEIQQVSRASSGGRSQAHFRHDQTKNDDGLQRHGRSLGQGDPRQGWQPDINLSWLETKLMDYLRISNKVELTSGVLENLMNTVDLLPQFPKFCVQWEGVYGLHVENY